MGKPLGYGERWREVNELLPEGGEGSFWYPGYPHDGHTDTILYRKQGGRIYEQDRMHIGPDGNILPS